MLPGFRLVVLVVGVEPPPRPTSCIDTSTVRTHERRTGPTRLYLRSNEGEIGPREVGPEDILRAAAQPSVDDLRVDRPEIDRVVDVVAAVLERGVLRIGIETRGRAVEPAIHPTAHRHHQGAGAV